MKVAKSKTTISAQIPLSLAKKLDSLARAERRSKSFYIKEALERFLEDVEEDIVDVLEAKERYAEFLQSESKAISLADLKKKYKL